MIAARFCCTLLMIGLLPGMDRAGAEPAVPVAKEIAPPGRDAPRHIARGGQGIVVLPSAPTRIALGDPSIVDVKLVSNKQLRLLGLKEGSTDLTVWDKAHPEGRSFPIVVGPDIAAVQDGLAKDPALAGVAAVSAPSGVTLRGQVGNLDKQQEGSSGAGEKRSRQCEQPDRRRRPANDRSRSAGSPRFPPAL